MSRSKIICLVLLGLGIAYAMIYGRTPKYQILQQLGTVVIMGALLNRQLSNRSVYLGTAFIHACCRWMLFVFIRTVQ